MNNEAWTHAGLLIMDGYRKVTIVRDNPDWDIVEFLDGFKSHKACFQANKFRTYANCCSVKENSNSSHENQGYGQKVARDEKRKANYTPTTTRGELKFSKKMPP